MKVKLYGTRGSIPVAGAEFQKYGGNTTCLKIESSALPDDMALVVDTGSGFSKLSMDLLSQQIKNMTVLYTHFHHDHTLGVTLAPHVFIPDSKIHFIGPKEQKVGAREVLKYLFRAPFFPVDYKNIGHKFSFSNLAFIGSQAIIFHPKGRSVIISVEDLQHIKKNGTQVKFKNCSFDLNECLVVTCLKTTHPEYTISYKFLEMSSGQSFVFLTDHECTSALSNMLKTHIENADLLIGDAQYPEQKYLNQTAGFGHGTPEYCVDLAKSGNVKRLGLTHHDNNANDMEVDKRLKEAKEHQAKIGYDGEVFACQDFQVIDLDS